MRRTMSNIDTSVAERSALRRPTSRMDRYTENKLVNALRTHNAKIERDLEDAVVLLEELQEELDASKLREAALREEVTEKNRVIDGLLGLEALEKGISQDEPLLRSPKVPKVNTKARMADQVPWYKMVLATRRAIHINSSAGGGAATARERPRDAEQPRAPGQSVSRIRDAMVRARARKARNVELENMEASLYSDIEGALEQDLQTLASTPRGQKAPKKDPLDIDISQVAGK